MIATASMSRQGRVGTASVSTLRREAGLYLVFDERSNIIGQVAAMNSEAWVYAHRDRDGQLQSRGVQRTMRTALQALANEIASSRIPPCDDCGGTGMVPSLAPSENDVDGYTRCTSCS